MDNIGLTLSPFPKLSSDEILELERIYKDMGEKTLDSNLCHEIAKIYSSSSNVAVKTSLSWQQVQQWFRNRQRVTQVKDGSSPCLLKLSSDQSDSLLLGNGDENSLSSKYVEELQFEARSTKDVAWHDVAMFLNYRVMSTGELEVRVRYAGFSKEQDEWMNVKEGVRERSIPLEPSECHKVKEGQLALCFLEREDYALYCDAVVVKVQRKIHDPEECNCTFIVRFVHDNTEEGISWNRICRRPTQEESAVYTNPAFNFTLNPTLNINSIESLWG
ncbi:hypothetical protein Fmac_012478 [Flemingia macrophylla]|uniref:SAWADEE domain-containing protein n=1 Tax=Flemingia macrophylla TaxID=520843 RepID=A0ABD1MQE6_9FABA